MAISQQQLASIISGKARMLCSEAGDRAVQQHLSNKNNGFDPDPSSYDDDGFSQEFDSMYGVSSDDDYSEPTYVGNNNTKVPANIRESMLSQPIDVSALGSVSVLDSIGLNPNKMKKQKQAPKVVNEQSMRQQPIAQTPSVDYTIIKAIVNECLKEYFEKRPLNESANLKTIGLSNGTISLVDNKGNIFKAKLEKIGNKNDK